MIYDVEMPPCRITFLPSFIKISVDVEALLKFCLSNLNVGITDGKELTECTVMMNSDGMIYISRSVYVYRVSCRLMQAFEQY
jgi:hypothetical protein